MVLSSKQAPGADQMGKQMIIETSDNRFYRVVETNQPDLAHCWYGVAVKRVGGVFVVTAKAMRASGADLVRKAATRVVEA